MNIYTSYLPHRTEPVPYQKLLADIIAEIASGKHQSLVQQIQNEEDKAKRNLLKGNLPMFFPTLSCLEENRLSDTATLTGIIQFDIDVQDNPETNFAQLKQQVSGIPECIYAFHSPSGGLKFGLLSDFEKHPDDDLHGLKERYKRAYRLAKDHISQFVDVTHDEAMNALKFPCYLSSDAEAFINENCSLLKVDANCTYTAPDYSSDDAGPVTDEQVAGLLKFIPKDLPYAERLHINFSVLGSLGRAGIPLLLNHWSKSDRKKLKQQLEQQAKSLQYGNIGHLVNVAKKYGYKPVGSRGRRNLKATPCDYQFPPLLTVEEASERLQSIVQGFFDTGESTLINVSTGFGKTQTALEILREIPPSTRVLYLVKDHALADEIRTKFYRIKTDTSILKKRIQRKSSITHIKGKKHLCLMPDVLEIYEDSNVTMPLAQCTQSCPEVDRCPYIEQFQKLGNVRLMTHNEFINEPSAWFHGNKLDEYGNPLPKRSGWKPDFIIVDEDWMRLEKHEESVSSSYDSLRNIVNDCRNGISLPDAIYAQQVQVITDYWNMHQEQERIKNIPFQSRDQYLQDKSQRTRPYSPILETLERYVVSGYDPDVLQSVIFDPKRKCLITTRMVEAASRYRDVPTLYLDATADERVVKSVHPEIVFHSLKVANAGGMNIYQLDNYNWTKQRLSKSDNRRLLVQELKPYLEKYDSVGLITYKNISRMPDFDKWLAGQLGIDNYAHFGGLRGLDSLSDVDCILIVGRNLIPLSDIEDYTRAIYPDVSDFDTEYLQVPVRMADGKAMSLGNRVYSDSRVESVKRHFSTAETVQAVGRARLIHGKPKDVFLFSNESLGGDVTVTGFFRYEEPRFMDAVYHMKSIGYCENKPAALQSLGISQKAIKTNRAGIDAEFKLVGIEKVTLKVRDRHYNNRKREYYVSDQQKLDEYLEANGLTVIS